MRETVIFSKHIRKKFEFHSYRNAASILANSFPDQFAHIVDALEKFQITTDMIRRSGGSKGLIAQYVDTLFPPPDWIETRISADLMVRLEHAKKSGHILHEYVRKGFLDGHRLISFPEKSHLIWNGTVRIRLMTAIYLRSQFSIIRPRPPCMTARLQSRCLT